MNLLKNEKRWIHILRDWYKWIQPLYRRRHCHPVTLLLHYWCAAALLITPFCQCYQPTHVDNTVLQMPRFHHAAAMLLLPTLPDAQTKKNNSRLQCKRINSHLIVSLLHQDSHWRQLNGRHSDWMGQVLLLPNRIHHWMTMNGRERTTSGTMHYTKIPEDKIGKMTLEGHLDYNSGVI